MKTPDFTTTILTDKAPQDVFNAINNPRGWWSAGIEGSTHMLNDEFIYHYRDVHYCKIKLIELYPIVPLPQKRLTPVLKAKDLEK